MSPSTVNNHNNYGGSGANNFGSNKSTFTQYKTNNHGTRNQITKSKKGKKDKDQTAKEDGTRHEPQNEPLNGDDNATVDLTDAVSVVMVVPAINHNNGNGLPPVNNDIAAVYHFHDIILGYANSTTGNNVGAAVANAPDVLSDVDLTLADYTAREGPLNDDALAALDGVDNYQ